MSELLFEALHGRACAGLKGPRAAEWLGARGVTLPPAPNSWAQSSAPGGSQDPLVARLGATEYFLEDAAGGRVLQDVKSALAAVPPGIYPVLREDSGFRLSGEGVHEALAQVCNVHFAQLAMASRPVIMTLMLGVAVLVVPQENGVDRSYRIWCDPSFGTCLSEEVRAVIMECGGSVRGVPG